MNHFADDNANPARGSPGVGCYRVARSGSGLQYSGAKPHQHVRHAPCVIVMETLRQLGCLNCCQTVGYTTSAEASGDQSRVVGYAGLLFA